MKNSLNVDVTKPTQELIILRGIPGSGKSTKAKEILSEKGGIIHSTDDLIESTGDYRAFFVKMNESKDFTDLSRMHSKNLVNANKSMRDGVSPVIIDNTNLKANEPKAYVNEALMLGYSDDNIKIVDVGTGGLDANALFERNTHGVPLDKIKSMMESHKSVGTLTLQKILESKDMYKNKKVKTLYSALVLTEKSRNRLLTTLGDKIPDGWDIFAHHMTIVFGEELPEDMKHMLGKEIELTAHKIGVNDMVMSVLVVGFKTLSDKPPHITIAVNVKEGGKPVMGSLINEWQPMIPIGLTGIVTEVKSNS